MISNHLHMQDTIPKHSMIFRVQNKQTPGGRLYPQTLWVPFLFEPFMFECSLFKHCVEERKQNYFC